MVPNSRREAPKPDPKNIRDLRLMYETCGKVDGNIEYKRLLDNKDYCEGAYVRMVMRVVPDTYTDTVRVAVEREKLTNYRKTSPMGCSYTPVVVVDWEHVYSFDEFRESPFYDLTIDEWGKYWRTAWDTHLMDEHEVYDNDGRDFSIWAHFYEHESDWLCNWRKTGKIREANIVLDRNGNVSISLDRESVFDGYIEKLARIIDEHEQMQEQLEKLKEHGIDLDDGTLSIKLWE